MPDLRSDDRYAHYTCGKCKGYIHYLASKGKPDVCPACGYGHGTRDVHDVPNIVRLNLNALANEDTASRGITEKTTITSR
jgi:hypothetical protein